ncbi:hypothetical protein D9M68_933650 [compost metagenome]
MEYASRQRDHCYQRILYQQLAQRLVGGAALENDALWHDDAGAAVGAQVLVDVIHEQYFRARGLDGKALVRLDAPFRRHEGGVGKNDIRVLVPFVFAGERVVFIHMRVNEAV